MKLMFVVFAIDAPITVPGMPWEHLELPGVGPVIGLLCQDIQESFGGMLRLDPAPGERVDGTHIDSTPAAIYMHPRHILCILETGGKPLARFFGKAQS